MRRLLCFIFNHDFGGQWYRAEDYGHPDGNDGLPTWYRACWRCGEREWRTTLR